MRAHLVTDLLSGRSLSGSEGKESTCNAEDLSLISRWRRSPGEWNGYSLQYSCLENSMDRGIWQATAHGVTESDTTEWLPTLSLSSLLDVTGQRWKGSGETPRKQMSWKISGEWSGHLCSSCVFGILLLWVKALKWSRQGAALYYPTLLPRACSPLNSCRYCLPRAQVFSFPH